MQNERIKTEEHIEYDSDDSPDDGSTSSSSKSSHHKLEPEVYKTRKDENFTEYYKTGRDNNNKVITTVWFEVAQLYSNYFSCKQSKLEMVLTMCLSLRKWKEKMTTN